MIWGPYEGQKEEIERLQTLLAEANAEAEDTFIPLTEDSLDSSIIDHVIQLKNGETVYMYMRDGLWLRRHRHSLVLPERWILQEWRGHREKGYALENIAISEQDAIEEGNRLLERLGRKDLALASVEKACAVDVYPSSVHGEGYWLIYVPCPEGSLPFCYENCTDNSNVYFPQEETVFAESWRRERIAMLITDEGVLDFSWQYPKSVVNIANANVQLLPFESIQESIRSLLNEGMRSDDPREDLLISRILLSSSIQKISGSMTAFLVPTWIIILTTESAQKSYSEPDVFLVSALDGSYVKH